jgi:hypothetical protein
MFSRTLRTAFTNKTVLQANRRMGHWLHKNARVEENQGIRENSIAGWKFDTDTIPKLLGYVIIPSALFWVVCIEELELKHEQMGSKMIFGMVPGKKTFDKDE